MFTQTTSGRSRLTAITVALLAACSADAADPQPSKPKTKPATVIPEVVITATKTETESWRTASSVTVIDRKKIEEQQFKMVPDALRQVPGLVIADRGTPGSTNGIFLRGTNSDQTLVVIDGRPVPANLAGLYNIETMTLDNVERIEVLRGPAASLYGGKTLGGVINIITRSGRGLKKSETTLSWEGGSFGWSREGLSNRGAAGIYDWSLELSRTDTQGYRINSQMQLNNAATKFGAQLAESLRFDLDLRYYNADVGSPGASTGFGANDPNDHVLSEFWSISPRLVWETSKRWTQTLTYQFGNFRQAATNFTPTFGLNNRITSRNHFFEYQSVFKVADWWTLTAGAWLQDIGYSRSSDNAFPFSAYDVDQAETNWAVFLQSKAEILPGWNLNTGIRHDEYSDFNDATTWRAGTSWRMPWTQTVLHANYGTAFAPASPQNREAALFGNPAFLKPEQSKGVEFGIEQPFADNKASVSLTYFHNSINNLIVFTPPFGPLQQINKARTQGLEAAFQWQPCDRFGFSTQYTYLDADDLTAGTRLVRRPRHTIMGDVWVKPVPKFRLGLGALYVIDREDGFGAAQRDVEDYLRLRLTASYTVCKNCDLFARVENLLGERYSEVLGFPSMRTGAYAGFRLRF
ncbi:TonB-dependent receptor [Prosthecobacter sp.]|uniref:TonB-dependent receptor plug domain-containing protein n=1 Tax=Prosthecobacter sp. TaxID=1965333 RepID=UPI001D940106|nr:TonB-dependent receptor [Prosthecobacter sp.]MCB1277316.1 TonB-dependent receptor [Prosthecobacter sp.]